MPQNYELQELIPGKFQQHAPSAEKTRPLPSELQLYDRVVIDFGSGQKVKGTIHGALFYDPALYYEVMIHVVNSPGDERYVNIEVPAGFVSAAEPELHPTFEPLLKGIDPNI